MNLLEGMLSPGVEIRCHRAQCSGSTMPLVAWSRRDWKPRSLAQASIVELEGNVLETRHIWRGVQEEDPHAAHVAKIERDCDEKTLIKKIIVLIFRQMTLCLIQC